MQVHAGYCRHECASDTKEECILLLRRGQPSKHPEVGGCKTWWKDNALQGREQEEQG